MVNATKTCAPFLEGMPLVLEYQVIHRQKDSHCIGSYEDVYVDLSVKIVNVNVEESFINEMGEDILSAKFFAERFSK